MHRNTQIAELKVKLTSGENFTLISGFGGVGKTAIARKLYHELKNSYNHIAWIKYNGSLKQSILDDVKLFTKEKNQDIRWDMIQSLFAEYEDNFLIFIDTITQEDTDLNWLTGLNAHLFITSRLAKIHNFEIYEIEPLNREQSIDVFYCYYEQDKKQEKKEIAGQLVDLVSCHTLSIELLARIANSPKYRFDLKKFLTDLQDNGFQFPQKIYTSHTYEELTISEHLAKLFRIADLTPEQYRVLGNFQILPKGLQVPCDFAEWIKSEDDALDKLVDSGWISFSENGYLMHDIVWEVVKLQLTDIPYEYAQKMIKAIVSGGCFNDKDDHLLFSTKIQIADAYAEYFPDENTKEWGNFLDLLGAKHRDKGEYVRALEYFKKAVGIQERVLGKDHLSTARTYNNIANVYSDKGEYGTALEYGEKALLIDERVLGTDHPSTATTYNTIGLGYHYKGEYDTALQYFRKALLIDERVGNDHQNTATTCHNIAIVYYDKGEYDRALKYFKKALDIYEKVLGKDHPSTAITYNTIALVYRDKGECDRAMEYYQKALGIQEKVLGKDHPDTATTYNNIALVYSDKGQYDTALDYFKKAFDIYERVLGSNHPETATTYNNIALVYSDKGEYDTALGHYKKAVGIYEKVFGNDHPHTASTYNKAITQFKA